MIKGIGSLASSESGAVGMALASAILWGIWWMPIRMLNEFGFEGAWAGLAMSIAAVPSLFLYCLTKRHGIRLTRRSVAGALLIGVAITTYSSALAFTDVVRAVLLFYLAPAWSIAFEWAFSGRKLTWSCVLAVAVSLFGMALILSRGELVGGNLLGDLLALASGFAWAIGAGVVFSESDQSPAGLALASVLGSILISAISVAYFGASFGSLPETDKIVSALPTAAVSGSGYFAAIMVMTIWAAKRIPPALMSFLLSAEIVSGVGTSALALDEPFGLIEVIGSVCVISAALIEFVDPARPRKNQTENCAQE